MAKYLFDQQTTFYLADEIWYFIVSSKVKNYKRAPLSGSSWPRERGLRRDHQVVVTSRGPGMEGAPLLGALLAGAPARNARSADPGRASVAALLGGARDGRDALGARPADRHPDAALVPGADRCPRQRRRKPSTRRPSLSSSRRDCSSGPGTDLSSPWRVVTFLQRHLLVTPPAHAAAFRPEDPVAYVGQESLFFAPFVAGAERCDRALDLGAGAGPAQRPRARPRGRCGRDRPLRGCGRPLQRRAWAATTT